MIEYLQRLQDKVLEKEATLLKGAERSQVIGSKYKEVATRDEKGQRPSKKVRGKYHGGATVEMVGANLCKRYMYTGQDCLVYSLR